MRLDLWGAVKGANNAIVYTEGKAVAEFVQLSKSGKLVSTMTVSHAFIDRYKYIAFLGLPLRKRRKDLKYSPCWSVGRRASRGNMRHNDDGTTEH